MHKKYTIYCHINKINGKKYVGQTCQELNKRWRKGEGYINSPLFYNAISKYGWDNFHHMVLTICDSFEEANKLEKLYISILRTNNDKYGYNLTKGGDGTIGFHHTEEARKKMSDSKKGKQTWMKGKHHSEDTKKKLSEAHKGKNAGKNHPNYGKHLSSETKNKISLNHADFTLDKSYRAKKIICVETGEIFNCIKSAALSLSVTGNNPGSNISACCRGKIPTAYGYHWKYL